MFAAVRAEPFSTRRVRPHEQTHSAPKADRLALLRATRTSLESIFLLAPDPDRALARALVQATSGAPAARAQLDGVGIRLWVVSGERAAELSRVAGRAQLYIADGHHRYAPAVAYTPDPRAAFDAVRAGKAAAAVLLNPTKVDEVFAVADAGEVMPPKSTYFAPKVPSGIVLRPVT